MKMKEILEKESNQLRNELAEQQKHLFELRTQAVTEKLEDPSQLSKTKKVIARILTVLRQRDLQGANGDGAQATEAGGEGAAAKPAARRTRKPATRGGKKAAAKKSTAKKAAAKTGTKARAATKKPAGKKAKKKTAAAAE